MKSGRPSNAHRPTLAERGAVCGRGLRGLASESSLKACLLRLLRNGFLEYIETLLQQPLPDDQRRMETNHVVELAGCEDVQALLEARELGMVDFKLVDVREHMEWQMGHISGADKLIPTSSFFPTLEASGLAKDENIILYCHVGSRSAHCARILGDMGYSNIGNLTHGIVSYGGVINRG